MGRCSRKSRCGTLSGCPRSPGRWGWPICCELAGRGLNLVSACATEIRWVQLALDDQLSEPVEKVVALVLGHFIDALRVVANGVNALPAGDRIRPDDGVNRLEVCSDVLWRTAFGAVQLEVVPLGTFVENGLRVSGSQSLQELLVRWRQTVVDLVARRPQSIAASLGKLGKT